MINESTKVFYVLTIGGKEVSERVETMAVLELHKEKLSESDRSLVEVTTVTNDGKQVLLG